MNSPYCSSSSLGPKFISQFYIARANCPVVSGTILEAVGVLKTLFKVALLMIIGAAFAGVVKMRMRPQPSGPVSYEQWPDVERNPAS